MTRQQRRYEERKGARTVGFIPIRNGKIEGRRATLFAAFVADGMGAMDADAAAWRAVARTLPAPQRFVRRVLVRPSKSDNPDWLNKDQRP